MTNTEMFAAIDRILDDHRGDNPSVIAVLQDVQEEFRYLPRETFDYLSEKLDVSMAKLFGVATFYENFSHAKR